MYILQGGFGGTPTADSRIAVPCPSDRNALRNPPRQHVPTVSTHFRPQWRQDSALVEKETKTK